MSEAERSQAARSPADVYDEMFVPALFERWAGAVAELARIEPGQDVLDVACGTGVLARAAKDRAGTSGRVVGIDPNPEMLAVARRKHPDVTWQDGRAEALPFADESFDAVVSQFGLMFFEDRSAALREMMRVLRPGGRLVVAVCDAVEHSPGYGALAALLHRLFGARVADAFRAPFVLGDPERLRALCVEAGIPNASVTRHERPVRFGSIASMISTERACVWTLGGMLDDAQFALLRAEAEEALSEFAADDGTVSFGMPALVIEATREEAP